MIRLARLLIDHADRMMPAARRGWGQAMKAELAHLPSTPAALRFALGCVQASYALRVRELMTLSSVARLTLAAWAMIGAAGYLLAAILMVLIKATPGLAPGDLGSDAGTAATLTFVRTYPWLTLATLPLVATLLAVGSVRLLRAERGAFGLLACGGGGAAGLALASPGAVWPLAWSLENLAILAFILLIWRLGRPAPETTPV